MITDASTRPRPGRVAFEPQAQEAVRRISIVESAVYSVDLAR